MRCFLQGLAVLANALAIALGAGNGLAAGPPPPNADGTFRTEGYVYTLETSTNRLFRTQESPLVNPLPRETLRAQDDPESAWGPVSGGLQLCLRFEKDVFQVGEPIIASVLVRNVSDRLVWDAVGIPGSTELFVTDVNGQVVPHKLVLPPAPKRHMFSLWPGTQYKFKLPLSDIFGLEHAGVYTVSVHKQAGETRAATNVIMSGNATLRIVTSKASAESSAGPTTSIASDSSQISRAAAGTRGQSAEKPAESPRTRATTQPTDSTADTPRENPQSDSSPSGSEAGGTHLGFASGPVRIGASVLLLLLASAVVFIVIRRARRHS